MAGLTPRDSHGSMIVPLDAESKWFFPDGTFEWKPCTIIKVLGEKKTTVPRLSASIASSQEKPADKNALENDESPQDEENMQVDPNIVQTPEHIHTPQQQEEEKIETRSESNHQSSVEPPKFLIQWKHVNKRKIVTRLNLKLSTDSEVFFEARMKRSLEYRQKAEEGIKKALMIGLTSLETQEKVEQTLSEAGVTMSVNVISGEQTDDGLSDAHALLILLRSGIVLPHRFLNATGLRAIGGDEVANGCYSGYIVAMNPMNAIVKDDDEVVRKQGEVELARLDPHLPPYVQPGYSSQITAIPPAIVNALVGSSWWDSVSITVTKNGGERRKKVPVARSVLGQLLIRYGATSRPVRINPKTGYIIHPSTMILNEAHVEPHLFAKKNKSENDEDDDAQATGDEHISYRRFGPKKGTFNFYRRKRKTGESMEETDEERRSRKRRTKLILNQKEKERAAKKMEMLQSEIQLENQLKAAAGVVDENDDPSAPPVPFINRMMEHYQKDAITFESLPSFQSVINPYWAHKTPCTSLGMSLTADTFIQKNVFDRVGLTDPERQHIAHMGTIIAEYFEEVRAHFVYAQKEASLEKKGIVKKYPAYGTLNTGNLLQTTKTLIDVREIINQDKQETLSIMSLPSYLRIEKPSEEWRRLGISFEIKKRFFGSIRHLTLEYHLSHSIILKCAQMAWEAIHSVQFHSFLFIPPPFEAPHSPALIQPKPKITTLAMLFQEDEKMKAREQLQHMQDEIERMEREEAENQNDEDQKLALVDENEKASAVIVSGGKTAIPLNPEDVVSLLVNPDKPQSKMVVNTAPGSAPNIPAPPLLAAKGQGTIIVPPPLVPNQTLNDEEVPIEQRLDVARQAIDYQDALNKPIPMKYSDYSNALLAQLDSAISHVNVVTLENVGALMMDVTEEIREDGDLPQLQPMLINLISVINCQLETVIEKTVRESLRLFLKQFQDFRDAFPATYIPELRHSQQLAAEERKVKREERRRLRKERERELRKQKQLLGEEVKKTEPNNSSTPVPYSRLQTPHPESVSRPDSKMGPMDTSVIKPLSIPKTDQMKHKELFSGLSMEAVVTQVTTCNSNVPPLFYVLVEMRDKQFVFEPPLISFRERAIRSIEQTINIANTFPVFEIPSLHSKTSKLTINAVPDLDSALNVRTKISQLFDDLEAGPLALVASLNRFSTFLSLPPDQFRQVLFAKNPTLTDISEQVKSIEATLEEVSVSIPPFLIVNAYTLDFRPTRHAFFNALGQLRNELLETLSNQCTDQCRAIIAEFKGYQDELNRLPQTAEELFALNGRVDQLLEIIDERENDISLLGQRFKMLEYFHFPPTQADTAARWESFVAPARLNKQMEGLPKIIRKLRAGMVERLTYLQTDMKQQIAELRKETEKYDVLDDFDFAEEYAKETGTLLQKIHDLKNQAELYARQEEMLMVTPHEYPEIQQLIDSFETVSTMWKTIIEWSHNTFTWTNTSFHEIDAYTIALTTDSIEQTLSHVIDVMGENRKRNLLVDLAEQVKQQVAAFQTRIPMVLKMSNPAIKARHWQMIANEIHKPINYTTPEFTLGTMLEMKLEKYPRILTIADNAMAEHAIETGLDRMSAEMNQACFEIMPHQNTDTHILSANRELVMLIDEQRAAVQSFLSSPPIAQYEARAQNWLAILDRLYLILNSWFKCQKMWIFLMPIFSGAEIAQRRPHETRRFNAVDATWRKLMANVVSNPHVLAVCGPQANNKTLSILTECCQILDSTRAGLSKYLDAKRILFPRLYFLSNEELLDLLSLAKEPRENVPHIHKLFNNVSSIGLGLGNSIISMISRDGEILPLMAPVDSTNLDADEWLSKIEVMMKHSLRAQSQSAIAYIGSAIVSGLEAFRAKQTISNTQTGTPSMYGMSEQATASFPIKTQVPGFFIPSGALQTPLFSDCITQNAVFDFSIFTRLFLPPTTWNKTLISQQNRKQTKDLKKVQTPQLTTHPSFGDQTHLFPPIDLVTPTKLQPSPLDFRFWNTQTLITTINVIFTDILSRLFSDNDPDHVSVLTLELLQSLEKSITAFGILDRSFRSSTKTTEILKIRSLLSHFLMLRGLVREILSEAVSFHEAEVDSIRVSWIVNQGKSKTNLPTTFNPVSYSSTSPLSRQQSAQRNQNDCTTQIHRQMVTSSPTAQRTSLFSCLLRTSPKAVAAWDATPQYHYDDTNGLTFQIGKALIPYGYEFLGSSTPPFIFTPQTKIIFQAAAIARMSNLSFSLFGPSGVGKTETCRILSRFAGQPYSIFTCTSNISLNIVLQFLRGYACSGCWCLLDEINLLEAASLSVIAQQIQEIQYAIASKQTRLVFQTDELSIIPSGLLMLSYDYINTKLSPSLDQYFSSSSNKASDFTTFEPSSHSIPDNLKSVYRPYALVEPDVSYIMESLLMLAGFTTAPQLAQLLVSLFSFSKLMVNKTETDSDFGIRLLKQVVQAAEQNLHPVTFPVYDQQIKTTATTQRKQESKLVRKASKMMYESESGLGIVIESSDGVPSTPVLLSADIPSPEGSRHTRQTSLDLARSEPSGNAVYDSTQLKQKELIAILTAVLNTVSPYLRGLQPTLFRSLISFVFKVGGNIEQEFGVSANFLARTFEEYGLVTQNTNEHAIDMRTLLRTQIISQAVSRANLTPKSSAYNLLEIPESTEVTDISELSTERSKSTTLTVDAHTLLKSAVMSAAKEFRILPTDTLISKCLQLHDQLQLRTGVFIIGAAGTGKTTIIKLLATSWTLLSYELNWALLQTRQKQQLLQMERENKKKRRDNDDSIEVSSEDDDDSDESRPRKRNRKRRSSSSTEESSEDSDSSNSFTEDDSEESEEMEKKLQETEGDAPKSNQPTHIDLIEQSIQNEENLNILEEMLEEEEITAWTKLGSEKDPQIAGTGEDIIFNRGSGDQSVQTLMKEVQTFGFSKSQLFNSKDKEKRMMNRTRARNVARAEIFSQVSVQVVYPFAFSEAEVMGEENDSTGEWKDGLLSSFLREASVGTSDAILKQDTQGMSSLSTTNTTGKMDRQEQEILSKKAHWILLDLSSKAVRWVELFNSALDEHGSITLTNGERLSLSKDTKILFESDSLQTASPATVTRCGVMNIDASTLSLTSLVESWLSRLQDKYVKIIPKKQPVSFKSVVEEGKQKITESEQQAAALNPVQTPGDDASTGKQNQSKIKPMKQETVIDPDTYPIHEVLAATLSELLRPLFVGYLPSCLSLIQKDQAEHADQPVSIHTLVRTVCQMLDCLLPAVVEQAKKEGEQDETDCENRRLRMIAEYKQHKAEEEAEKEMMNTAVDLLKNDLNPDFNPFDENQLPPPNLNINTKERKRRGSVQHGRSPNSRRDSITSHDSHHRRVSVSSIGEVQAPSTLTAKPIYPTWAFSGKNRLTNKLNDSISGENLSSLATAIFLKRRQPPEEDEPKAPKTNEEEVTEKEPEQPANLAKKPKSLLAQSLMPNQDREKSDKDAIQAINESIQVDITAKRSERRAQFHSRVQEVFVFCFLWGVSGMQPHRTRTVIERSIRRVHDEMTSMTESTVVIPPSRSLFDMRFNIASSTWEEWETVAKMGIDGILNEPLAGTVHETGAFGAVIRTETEIKASKDVVRGNYFDTMLQVTPSVANVVYLMRVMNEGMAPLLLIGPQDAGKHTLVDSFFNAYLKESQKAISSAAGLTSVAHRQSALRNQSQRVSAFSRRNTSTIRSDRKGIHGKSSRILPKARKEMTTRRGTLSQTSARQVSSRKGLQQTTRQSAGEKEEEDEEEVDELEEEVEEPLYLIQQAASITLNASTTAAHAMSFIQHYLQTRRGYEIAPQAGIRLLLALHHLEATQLCSTDQLDQGTASSSMDLDGMYHNDLIDFERQNPLELLRLIFNEGGWPDLSNNTFAHPLKIQDVAFLSSSTTKWTDSSNSINVNIPPRLLRHYFVIQMPSPENSVLQKIFVNTLNHFAADHQGNAKSILEETVAATFSVHESIRKFVDTHSSHAILPAFSFNTTSLTSVFEGILMTEDSTVTKQLQYPGKDDKNAQGKVISLQPSLSHSGTNSHNDSSLFDESKSIMGEGKMSLGLGSLATDLPQEDISRRDSSFEQETVPFDHKIDAPSSFINLWYHEMLRTYSDSLGTIEHQQVFMDLLNETSRKTFGVSFSDRTDVNGNETYPYPIFGDFADQERHYVQLEGIEQATRQLKAYLEEYNNTTMEQPLSLILFEEAVLSLVKLCRIFRMYRGHVSLVGGSGTGRYTLTRLAAYVTDCTFYHLPSFSSAGIRFGSSSSVQDNPSTNSPQTHTTRQFVTKRKNQKQTTQASSPGAQWKQEMKMLMLNAGDADGIPHILFIDDTLIQEPVVLEDVCYLLRDGFISGLMSNADLKSIYTGLESRYYDEARQVSPKESTLNQYFIKRLKENIHIVLCISPSNPRFSQILRAYPDIIKRTQPILWNLWTDNSLRAIAHSFFQSSDPFSVPIWKQQTGSRAPSRPYSSTQRQLTTGERDLQRQGEDISFEALVSALENEDTDAPVPPHRVGTAKTGQLSNLSTVPDDQSESNPEKLEGDLFVEEADPLIPLVDACIEFHYAIVDLVQSRPDALDGVEEERPLQITASHFRRLLDTICSVTRKLRDSTLTQSLKLERGVLRVAEITAEAPRLEKHLVKLLPLLQQASNDIDAVMQRIQEESTKAEQTRRLAQDKEAKLNVQKEVVAQKLAVAEAELRKNAPDFDRAQTALSKLNSKHIAEIRRIRNPPPNMMIVIEALSIILGRTPSKLPNGQPDYWGDAQLMFGDADFLKILQQYDARNMSEDVMARLSPYIANPQFTPKSVERVSVACKSLCFWIRSVYQYHQVWLQIAPLIIEQQEQEKAQREMEDTLNLVRNALAVLEKRLTSLQRQKEEALSRRQQLIDDQEESKKNLALARQLTKELASEGRRWASDLAAQRRAQPLLTGNALLSAAMLTYTGFLSVSERKHLIQDVWPEILDKLELPHLPIEELIRNFVGELELLDWTHKYSLPNTLHTVTSATIVKFSTSWPFIIDPQQQALKWLLAEGGNKIKVVSSSSPDAALLIQGAIHEKKNVIFLLESPNSAGLINLSQSIAYSSNRNEFSGTGGITSSSGNTQKEEDKSKLTTIEENGSNYRTVLFGKGARKFWVNEILPKHLDATHTFKSAVLGLSQSSLRFSVTANDEVMASLMQIDTQLSGLLLKQFVTQRQIRPPPPNSSRPGSTTNRQVVPQSPSMRHSALSTRRTSASQKVDPPQQSQPTLDLPSTLAPQLEKKRVMIVGTNPVELPPDFRIMLLSISDCPNLPEEYVNNFTVVDFTVTSDSLIEQLLSMITKAARPQLDRDIQNSTRELTELRRDHTKQEESLLDMLATHTLMQLLDPVFFDKLSKTKALTANIEAKVNSTKETQKLQNEALITFNYPARRLASLFVCISGMNKLNPMYRLSLNRFLGCVQDALSDQKLVSLGQKPLKSLPSLPSAPLPSTGLPPPSDEKMASITFLDDEIIAEINRTQLVWIDGGQEEEEEEVDEFIDVPEVLVVDASDGATMVFPELKTPQPEILHDQKADQPEKPIKEKKDKDKKKQTLQSMIHDISTNTPPPEPEKKPPKPIKHGREFAIINMEEREREAEEEWLEEKRKVERAYAELTAKYSKALGTILVRRTFTRFSPMFFTIDRELFLSLYSLRCLLEEGAMDEMEYCFALSGDIPEEDDHQLLDQLPSPPDSTFFDNSPKSPFAKSPVMSPPPVEVKTPTLLRQDTKPQWASKTVWDSLTTLSRFPRFSFLSEYLKHSDGMEWIRLLSSSIPQNQPFPSLNMKLNSFPKSDKPKASRTNAPSLPTPSSPPEEEIIIQPPPELKDPITRFLLLRALRPDSMAGTLQTLTIDFFGRAFSTAKPRPLVDIIKNTPASTPLVLLTTQTSRTADTVQDAADTLSSSLGTIRVKHLSTSDESVKRSSRIITEGSYHGQWIVIQNCHLAPIWLNPLIPYLASNLLVRAHSRFRFIFISKQTPLFPPQILQHSTIVAIESTQSFRSSLTENIESLQKKWPTQSETWRRLAVSAADVTASTFARHKFGRSGWRVDNDAGSTSDWMTALFCLDQEYGRRFEGRTGFIPADSDQDISNQPPSDLGRGGERGKKVEKKGKQDDSLLFEPIKPPPGTVFVVHGDHLPSLFISLIQKKTQSLSQTDNNQKDEDDDNPKSRVTPGLIQKSSAVSQSGSSYQGRVKPVIGSTIAPRGSATTASKSLLQGLIESPVEVVKQKTDAFIKPFQFFNRTPRIQSLTNIAQFERLLRLIVFGGSIGEKEFDLLQMVKLSLIHFNNSVAQPTSPLAVFTPLKTLFFTNSPITFGKLLQKLKRTPRQMGSSLNNKDTPQASPSPSLSPSNSINYPPSPQLTDVTEITQLSAPVSSITSNVDDLQDCIDLALPLTVAPFSKSAVSNKRIIQSLLALDSSYSFSSTSISVSPIKPADEPDYITPVEFRTRPSSATVVILSTPPIGRSSFNSPGIPAIQSPFVKRRSKALNVVSTATSKLLTPLQSNQIPQIHFKHPSFFVTYTLVCELTSISNRIRFVKRRLSSFESALSRDKTGQNQKPQTPGTPHFRPSSSRLKTAATHTSAMRPLVKIPQLVERINRQYMFFLDWFNGSLPDVFDLSMFENPRMFLWSALIECANALHLDPSTVSWAIEPIHIANGDDQEFEKYAQTYDSDHPVRDPTPQFESGTRSLHSSKSMRNVFASQQVSDTLSTMEFARDTQSKKSQAVEKKSTGAFEAAAKKTKNVLKFFGSGASQESLPKLTPKKTILPTSDFITEEMLETMCWKRDSIFVKGLALESAVWNYSTNTLEKNEAFVNVDGNHITATGAHRTTIPFARLYLQTVRTASSADSSKGKDNGQISRDKLSLTELKQELTKTMTMRSVAQTLIGSSTSPTRPIPLAFYSSLFSLTQFQTDPNFHHVDQSYGATNDITYSINDLLPFNFRQQLNTTGFYPAPLFKLSESPKPIRDSYSSMSFGDFENSFVTTILIPIGGKSGDDWLLRGLCLVLP
ncbi:putative Dynein axonemal heavy chain 1 [Blattamonas nauphoetae]|uniref:Dynein axonemal heavy chain 1 n=1 Tax=Blattamonas nauphoetae TaxID=2049346 RepID=A0ABQ9YHP2_9EUKA|nr:putative Dynein axonemal heavy chain 1 [Blattamonas nauphoetae]